MRSFFLHINCVIFTTLGLASTFANAENTLSVQLFGQPCVMKGSVNKGVLESLHAMSPEKVKPNLTITEMEKLKSTAAKATDLTVSMTNYRDHLVKRLSAKISFESSIKQIEKKNAKKLDPEILIQNVKEHISPLRFPDYKMRVLSQFKGLKGTALPKSFTEKLRDEYDMFIQQDTEEEFHRMLKSSQIRYECHFDESSESDPNEMEDEDEVVQTKSPPLKTSTAKSLNVKSVTSPSALAPSPIPTPIPLKK